MDQLPNMPSNKMSPCSTSIKEGYLHLYTSAIDSTFSMLPYAFWELMALEMNRYAAQYMEREREKYIAGYKWELVSVKEILVFFGMLIYYMLYPQTGRKMRDAWKDPQRNKWTVHMSQARFIQIRCMLHFNDNTNEESLKDSLHKIRPLLNIVKKTLGRYANHGSEVSFDEATMACFSHYARHLLSFNPMKPTGKFHFKIYMVCCAVTNLTLRIRIHAKDGCDDEATNAAVEQEQINKTDKLTLSICDFMYNFGVTVNMDNYYMSTIFAAHLRGKGVFCRGTICFSRKFVPKSVLFSSAEVRTLPRGTARLAVNPTHNMIALGWLDNKAVHFISTSDTIAVKSVKRRVGNQKVDVPAPELVCNYNKYMGGIDRHDRLRSTFSLGKRHKFKNTM
jgi:hypothetical protein